MIIGHCAVCGREFKVDDHYAGMVGKCKACGAAVQVPGGPDTGLDGLPALPASAAQAPVPTGPPTGAPDLPAEPEPPAAPAGEALSPRAFEPAPDARSHMHGPDHGPTAVEGHFLAREPGPEPSDDEPADLPPTADRALVSRRIITSIDSVETPSRPWLITVACIVLGLAGLAFAARFALAAVQNAGLVGAGLAVLGAALAGVGLCRIWTGHWDGLIPAALFCLLAIGGAFLLASAAGAGRSMVFDPFVIGLLASDGLAILLLVLTFALGASREHLAL